MEGVEIPSYFLCPVSLQMMRDPVTLPTGITYDRDSIERWLFSGKHNTCPVTKQTLPDCDLTPNHTLRRLIQAWCALNSSSGIERFPTPRPPVDAAQIAALLDDAKRPHSQLSSLRRLKAIVSESERNRRCVRSDAGVADLLAAVIKSTAASTQEEPEPSSDGGECTGACDVALDVLHSLQLPEEALLDLVVSNGDSDLEPLTAILRRPNSQSRVYGMLLHKSVVGAIASDRSIAVTEELFREVVNVLRDRISQHATKAALHVLAVLSQWGRNRIKAADAGAVPVLIELLLDEPERKVCEMALVVLDRLCGCANGRAALVGHAAGVAVVSRKILRVSYVASERAMRILHSVSRFSATPPVLQEMLQTGVVSKLCMVLQVECGLKTKEKAREILSLHSRVWRNSPCISPQLLVSYPSS